MSYAPQDSPGARTVERVGGSPPKDERMEVAKDVMRGARTARPRTDLPPTPTADDIDRGVLKAGALDRLLEAKVNDAQTAYEDELAQVDEDAFDPDWLAEAQEQGWLDEDGNVSETADDHWLSFGVENGYFNPGED